MSKIKFIIAGERRSGSSTLYNLLKQHPEIEMVEKEDYNFFIEPELFSRVRIEDNTVEDWYLKHNIASFEQNFKVLKEKKLGYKNADLLWWKSSHKKIGEFLPETKFVFILRDPIKRAESQYFNELKKQREKLTFKESIQREKNKQLNQWEKLHLAYMARGKYVESLKHFYQHVPKNRVKVIILEDLHNNFTTEMISLCGFLGIDKKLAKAIKPLHSNKEDVFVRKDFANNSNIKWLFDIWDRITEFFIVKIKNKKDLRYKLRKILRFLYIKSKRKEMKTDKILLNDLRLYYRDSIKQLEDLLGRKINFWNYD